MMFDATKMQNEMGMVCWRCVFAIQNAVIPKKESSRYQAVYYHESVTLDVEGRRRIMILIAMD